MNNNPFNDHDVEREPCYVISIAAKMLGIHAQTLRYYERLGLVEPSRTQGNFRMYSQTDLNRVRQIKRLMTDLGVNLAGVEVILRMSDKIQELEREIERLTEDVRIAHDRRALPERPAAESTGAAGGDREEVIYL